MINKHIKFQKQLFEQIEKARGLVSFSAWVRQACEEYLKNTDTLTAYTKELAKITRERDVAVELLEVERRK